MQKIFKRIYTSIVYILFLFIITYLCYLSYVQTCYVSIQYTSDITFFLKDHLYFNLFCTIVLLILIFFLCKSKLLKKIIENINNDYKLYVFLKYLFLTIIAITGFLWLYGTQFDPQGDQNIIIMAVEQFKNGDYSLFNSGEYMEANLNQIGLFIFYYLLSFVSFDNLYLLIQIINLISVLLIYKSLSDIVKMHGYDNIICLLVIISSLLFPILLIYTWLLYGNIPSMALALLAIKYELKFFKEYKIGNAFKSALYISLSVMLKSFGLIYLIAICIYAIFKILYKKNLKGITIIILITLGFMIQNTLPKSYIETKINHKLDQGQSYYAYIAMGMQDGDRAPGWHNKYNINTYHDSFNNKDIQRKEAIKAIKNRFNYFIQNPSQCLKFYNLKTASQWNNPTFEMFYGLDDDYGYGFQYRFGNPNSLTSLFETFLKLSNQKIIQNILNIEQSLILFGNLLYLVFVFLNNEKKMDELLLPLIFIGGFLFLFIWEAKSQYALYFYIVPIVYGILGYKKLYDYFSFPYKIKKAKLSIILLYFSISIIIFSLSFKSYLITDNQKYGQYIAYGNTYDWFTSKESS